MSEQSDWNPNWAEKRRQRALETGRPLLNAPKDPLRRPTPRIEGVDLLEGLEDLKKPDTAAISDAAKAVNDACDSIEIFEVYDKLVGKYREDPRGHTENIMAICPAHDEKKPSAWFGIKNGIWQLCCGHDMSIGWDKFKLAGFVWNLDTKADFWEIKTRMAEEFRGVKYTKPSPPRPTPSPAPPAGTHTGRTEDGPEDGPEDPWEQAVEEQKRKTLIRLEGDHRARQQRASGLFTPPPSFDSLEIALAQPDPPIEWTIENLHSVGGNTTITASYKVGKTTFMMNLIKALVDQEKFLGEHEVRALDGRIAYWNFEVDEVQINRNFRDMSIKKLANIWHLPLRGYNFNIMDDAVYAWAVEEIRRREIEVLILDPFGVAYFGDENSNSEVIAFNKRLDQLKREAGIKDLFMPVHTGRSVEEGKERARGASALDGWADNLWVLAEHTETGDRYFKAGGRRVEMKERELKFDRDTNSLSYSVFRGTRKEKASNVLKGEILAFISANPGCSKTAIENEVRGKAEAIRATLKNLVSNLDVVVVTGPNRTQQHYLQGEQPLGAPV